MDIEWRVIPGFSRYEVSSEGEIRSVKTQRLRKLTNLRGYRTTTLINDAGAQKGVFVHRLVLLAFVGPSSLQANHINFNRADNRLENLEYVTQQENLKHSRNAGRFPKVTNPSGFNGTACRKGEAHSRARLSAADVMEIRSSNLSTKELSVKFKISTGYVNQLKKRKSWTHLK